eukprot:gene18200-23862_t
MEVINHDSLGGRGITIVPSSGEYNTVLLWFHGLGDTADGWSDLIPELNLEKTKYILPTAPIRPISLNGGMSMPGWSDIYGLDETSKEDLAGFNESAERVQTIVNQEITNGISPSNIFIGGFSQGGALALHYSLRSPLKLGGCIAFSSWLPFNSDFPAALSESSKTLPIVQVHGDNDYVVQFHWGSQTHKLLSEIITNPPPEFVKIPRHGHGFHPRETIILKSFIEKYSK